MPALHHPRSPQDLEVTGTNLLQRYQEKKKFMTTMMICSRRPLRNQQYLLVKRE